MVEKKEGLEGLVEGLMDSDVVKKVADVAEDLKDKVDLEKIGETVKDTLEKGGDVVGNLKDQVEDALEKTDIDDKLMEKGSELLEGVKGLFNKK